MSSVAFPVNDLLRRRLQTGLSIATLTLSVASTLFLLFFSSHLGFGLGSATGLFTEGINALFSQFILFIGILVFAIGAVLSSFIAFFMMSQRTRDFGLIKAIGCPNSLVAGYFMTELFTTTVAGCILGVIAGFLMDYGVTELIFSSYKLPNLWFAPLVLVVFFVLALIFGLIPLFRASRISPAKAISTVHYYELTTETKHKLLSKSGLTWSIASRSLLRRQSATFRIVILFSIVFILLTVSIAGGVIASGTTAAWVQDSTGKNTIAIATTAMGNQYVQLLSSFSGGSVADYFNYSASDLAIPNSVIQQLSALPYVAVVDSRLILYGQIQEVGNFSFSDTGTMSSVGGNRTANSLVVGVNPADLASSWNVEGRFLSQNDTFQAVVGDSIALSIYSPDPNLGILQANPLVEDLTFEGTTFNIVGVCVDPVNNGFVTYTPIQTLEKETGFSTPNILLVTFKNSVDQTETAAQIKTLLQKTDPNLNVFPLTPTIEKDESFLALNWQTIMIMPLFTLISAALCMVSYMMLAADEQHQELAVLRSIGAKPKFVVLVLAIQSLVVLFSSFGVGISLGTIITLLILMPQPIVTGFTILEITGLLFSALAGISLFSLYPAFKLARAKILQILT